LRDVTATVESIPLITASILSKKAAEGAQSLVFDVKCGSGAFMKTFSDAHRLAESLVETGKALGLRTVGIITDMSQPLGRKVGNFFEVEESIDCLAGRGPGDLMEVIYRLTAWMLVAAGKARDLEEARGMCEASVADGRAMELFRRNVRSQGGDLSRMDALYGLHRSPHSFELRARSPGYIESIDAYRIGLAGVYLGVGRNTTGDPVYPDVGFIFERGAGDPVKTGDLVATVYGKDQASLEVARPLVEEALSIGHLPPAPRAMVLQELATL
ncbi:MAG TPA: thymidine phosphorylase, partial [Magnetospirillaceae bacterium]|nr:thymidine phosphorylase [Magnetospirillaceae bacterium]